MDLKICDADDPSTVYQRIDFANISTVDLSGDRSYATGGQKHGKVITVGETKSVVIGQHLITTFGEVTNLGKWSTDDSASVNGNSLVINE